MSVLTTLPANCASATSSLSCVSEGTPFTWTTLEGPEGTPRMRLSDPSSVPKLSSCVVQKNCVSKEICTVKKKEKKKKDTYPLPHL